ncbi:MAG: T9SS type A sorting domain-containing protein [Saprospiraceae bacterium]|nr:T9SS type A sorting domain-containing protein [Saprospiraceae bacterium]
MKLIYALFLFVLGGLVVYSCKQSNVHLTSQNTQVKLKPAEEYFRDKYGDLDEAYFKNKNMSIREDILKNTYQRGGSPRFSGDWVSQGPGNIGCRINSIAIHPKNENAILVGLSQGGIFKSTVGGIDFDPIFDAQENLSIGDIEYDPVNPDIIYAATGDLNGGFYMGLGNGMYKSEDGGSNWKNIGLAETRVLSKIVIDPKSTKTIYVAALGNLYERNEHRGIYKSTDGGNTWNKIFYIADSVGITDLFMDPSNSATLYAASWGRTGNHIASTVQGINSHLYKSTDAGFTWSKMEGGLPTTNSNGRIALAIYPKNPKIMYARYNRSINCGFGAGQNISELYYTEDAGTSWKSLPIKDSTSGLPCEVLGGFGWYFSKIIINPNDPKDLMILGVDLYRTKDGGYQWSLESPEWFTYEVHADKHDIVYLKDGSYLLATDGGLYKKDFHLDAWIDMDFIQGTQLYRVAYNPHKPNYYYGGAQDNGTFGGNKEEINEWERIWGGDGFQMAFSRDNPLIIYTESQNGALEQSQDGGLTFDRFTRGFQGSKNWDMPYQLSWHDSKKLIAGSIRVYVNRHDSSANFKAISPILNYGRRYGARGTPTISTLDESRLDSNVIIAGTTNGNLWVTYNAGQSWDSISINLPAGYISSVKTSVKDINTLYVSISGQRDYNNAAQVYRSNDRGKTWQSISSNLPKVPVFDLYILPKYNDSILFVGNDIGVYVSIDAGQSWERLGDNMSYIPVYDMELNEKNNELIAGTFARSIQTFNLDRLTKQNVSVKENLANNYSIFPNPATEFITISNYKFPSLYKIINVEGKNVKTGKLNSEREKIILSGLQNGSYILSIEGKRKRFSIVK